MSVARPDTWMPMYWGDYTRDTGHLNATMHGAYQMLIKHYWCTGVSLPDDDGLLWRIATCDSPAQWKKIRPVIAAFFHIADGLWRHKRIEQELSKAAGITNVRSKAGKEGAERRWQNHSKRVAEPSNGHRQTDAQSQSPPVSTTESNQSSESHEPTARETTTEHDAVPEAEEPSRKLRFNGRPTNGLRQVGSVFDGKRRKAQDKADADMRRHLQHFAGMTLVDATETVDAARNPQHSEHDLARRLCEKHSRDHHLGWFPHERDAA